MVEHQGIAPCIPVWKTGVYLSTLIPEKQIGNLRIQFPHRSFNRICRILPDTASRRFHATRPKPQSRKPAWLPLTGLPSRSPTNQPLASPCGWAKAGGDSSLRFVLSAFIFRLPRGQQRSITPPCESNRPPQPLRGSGRPDCAKHSGIKPLSASTADASLRSDAGIAPATFEFQVRRSTIELISYETCASCGFVIFWITLCHTPPVLLLRSHTELQDFRRNAWPGLSTQPDAVPSPRVLPAGSCMQSSNRPIALVPSLSLFGVSAVLGATVSNSLHRWPRLLLHSSFQHSSSSIDIGNKPAGMGLHEWPQRGAEM